MKIFLSRHYEVTQAVVPYSFLYGLVSCLNDQKPVKWGNKAHLTVLLWWLNHTYLKDIQQTDRKYRDVIHPLCFTIEWRLAKIGFYKQDKCYIYSSCVEYLWMCLNTI